MGGHRSLWKQQNKQHKTGRHRSKGMVDLVNNGRVNVKTASRRKKHELGRENRKNQSRQLREKKREEILALKRSIGKGNTCPHMVVVIPLHSEVDVVQLKELVQSCVASEGMPICPSPLSTAGFTFNLPRFKHRFQIIQPHAASLPIYLDYVRMADTVVFVVNMSENEPIDEEGVSVLKTLQSSGMSSYMFCGQNLQSFPPKKRNLVKNATMKSLKVYVKDVKLQVVETQQDTFSFLRMISERKRKRLGMWDQRSFLLGEKVEYENGVLKVSGYVRNREIDVKRLVHVVGWGNFRIKCIQQVAEPCRFVAQSNKVGDGKTRVGDRLFEPFEVIKEISVDPSLQQDLTAEAEVDPLDGEQTWPTDEELQAAQMEQEMLKTLKKKTIEGSSMYQSEWMMDDNDDWQECDDDDDVSGDDDEGSDVSDGEGSEDEMACEYQPLDDDTESQMNDDKKSVTFSTVADTESVMMGKDEDKIDEDDLMRYRDQRSHEQFPDEVDTPRHIRASLCFNRYRGLKSFRTSPWDCNENLPQDYARIFRFKNFTQMKTIVKKSEIEDQHSIKCGSYVTIHLADVDEAFVTNHDEKSPLSIYSLFPLEQKMSMLNFALKKINTEVPIKSKDRLLFYCGFRKFSASPIFSDHTHGSKHKLERYMPNEGVFIASVFAPITFPPSNVLVFKEGKEEEGPVAIGILYNVNPDRIIVKRKVLSGHPFKVNKKTAVVRYMFFNPDDVNYFKEIELRTKFGRHGHIKYPVGTHGLMKCVFDGQLTSQDTATMSLYKRVYPKYTYQQITPMTTQQQQVVEQQVDEMME